jgi:hypothetical protein
MSWKLRLQLVSRSTPQQMHHDRPGGHLIPVISYNPCRHLPIWIVPGIASLLNNRKDRMWPSIYHSPYGRRHLSNCNRFDYNSRSQTRHPKYLYIFTPLLTIVFSQSIKSFFVIACISRLENSFHNEMIQTVELRITSRIRLSIQIINIWFEKY